MAERINWVIGPDGYFVLVIGLNSILEMKPYKSYVRSFDFKVKRVSVGSDDFELYPNFITREEIMTEYKYNTYKKRIWVKVPYGGSYPILVPINYNGDYDKPEIITFDAYIEDLNAIARVTLQKQDFVFTDDKPRLNFIVDDELYYVDLLEGEDFFNVVVDYETFHINYVLLYL